MWFLFSAAVMLLIVAPVSWLFYTEFPWWSFRRKPEPEPVFDFHRDELSTWDDQFFELTGKTLWQAQCEADPELCKSQLDQSSAMNNINPFYQQQMLAQQQQGTWDQLGQFNQLGAQQAQHGLLGASGGLGLGALGGLLGGYGKKCYKEGCTLPGFNHFHAPGLKDAFKQ